MAKGVCLCVCLSLSIGGRPRTTCTARRLDLFRIKATNGLSYTSTPDSYSRQQPGMFHTGQEKRRSSTAGLSASGLWVGSNDFRCARRRIRQERLLAAGHPAQQLVRIPMVKNVLYTFEGGRPKE